MGYFSDMKENVCFKVTAARTGGQLTVLLEFVAQV
jgi:hypothetical protein